VTVYDTDIVTFALDVYRDKDRPSFPQGYYWLCDCPDDLRLYDYFGAAYYMVSDDTVNLVIAHRGTQLNFEDLLDDLRIALGKAPLVFESCARIFTDFAKSKIKALFPDKTDFVYVHTGHSLGAVIAELCTANEYSNGYANAFCASFESPGSKPIIVDLISQGKLPKESIDYLPSAVWVYNADANIINTCNEQISYGVIHNYVGYQFTSEMLLPVDKIYYATVFALDQHQMRKMYDCMRTIGEGDFLKNWPIGFEAGYRDYMSYSSHQFYWDHAIKNYWDNNPDVRAAYDREYNRFSDYIIKTYLLNNVTSVALRKFGIFGDISDEYVFVEKSDFENVALPEGKSDSSTKCLIM
jgi:hypothetical protein